MFEERVAELEALARQQGLDFFPIVFEGVPQDMMTEIAAYGLPTRARHWSYGKVYQSQRLYGTMGLSKIYEIVLNSNPCLAFWLDTNPEIANLLVAAHIFGHGDFFKHSYGAAPITVAAILAVLSRLKEPQRSDAEEEAEALSPHPRFLSLTMSHKQQLYQALQAYFQPRAQAQG